MLIPLARTAFSKEDGAQLKKYATDVNKNLKTMTPWRKGSRFRRSGDNKYSSPLREELLAKGVKPGEVTVLMGAGDVYLEDLYGDAQIIR